MLRLSPSLPKPCLKGPLFIMIILDSLLYYVPVFCNLMYFYVVVMVVVMCCNFWHITNCIYPVVMFVFVAVAI